MATLFDEILFDPGLLRFGQGESPPMTGSPEYANTDIRNPGTGIHKVNVSRFDAVETLNIGVEMKDDTEVRYFLNMWRGGYGSAVGFRVRVPYDYFVLGEPFGVGDGVETEFPLYVTYTRPGVSARQDVRRIVKPVWNGNLDMGSSSLLYEPDGVTSRVITVPFKLYQNGVDMGAVGWQLGNTVGKVYFSVAPANGVVLSCDMEFDTPMAFVGNGFNLTKDIGGKAQGLGLREILPAELEID